MTAGLTDTLSSHPLLAVATLFGAGVVTSLTPCIYPMIPITAGIISGTSAPGASRYRQGSWTPVTVYLSGQGVRGVGQLTVTVHQSGHSTAYTRNIIIWGFLA